jgi:hypothetical protein
MIVFVYFNTTLPPEQNNIALTYCLYVGTIWLTDFVLRFVGLLCACITFSAHLLLFWVKLIISTCEFLSPSLSEGINNGPSSLSVTSSSIPGRQCCTGSLGPPVLLHMWPGKQVKFQVTHGSISKFAWTPSPTSHTEQVSAQRLLVWLTLDIAKPEKIWPQAYVNMDSIIDHIQNCIPFTVSTRWP